MSLFAKLWVEMYQTENVDRKFLSILSYSPLLTDYIDGILLDERASLNNTHIYQFFNIFFPKVSVVTAVH